ncbi:flavin reductase family protein [Nonomuraea lactucae]|uniref:flavin reductase family protein n=1 Tax=Nonomuraea lactucae TaxID=2249762 RepID=UPI000DE224A0|nr:flavin reductase family protein [Nonomuraea lactucae]
MTAVIPPMATVNPATLRLGFGQIPSGIAALCALLDDEPTGMVASTLTGVSLDPVLVSVCVQRSSRTWPRLREAPRLGISVLAEDQGHLCLRLARPEGDRFSGVPWRGRHHGAILIDGAALHLETHLVAEYEAGDHVIALLGVEVLRGRTDVEPAVFHRSAIRRLR